MTPGKHQPRGVAMIIVLAVVAVATVLSFALVGSQSVLTQASGNAERAMQADALAESGLQLAAYYLQHPDDAPVLNSDGYYPGQNNVSLGSAVAGTVDITVTKPTADTFYIHSRSSSDSGLSRAVAAKATVGYAYIPADAMSINSALSIYSNMDITGTVRATGAVNVSAGGRVTGTIYAPSIAGSMVNVTASQVVPTQPPPTPTDISSYGTYTYKGNTYSATTISGNVSGTLGPTATNPLGVYRATADVTVAGPLTVNGSLVVATGKLHVKADLTVDAAKDMPGLIVQSDTLVYGNSRKVKVHGLTWLGGKLMRGGLVGSSNSVQVTGALQFGSAAAVDTTYNGTVKVTYSEANAGAINFSPSTVKTATSVRLIAFTPSAGEE